jgi:Protein of unknown function (DUF3465)
VSVGSRVILALLALALAGGLGRWAAAPTADFAGQDALLAAAQERRSDLLVEVEGPVARVLADDRDGSPHQRFVIRVGAEHTVLVAHNLELAERVPLAEGERVTVRGEYEWNALGGVIHWTHDDPSGRHPAGFVRHQGRTYQ